MSSPEQASLRCLLFCTRVRSGSVARIGRKRRTSGHEMPLSFACQLLLASTGSSIKAMACVGGKPSDSSGNITQRQAYAESALPRRCRRPAPKP